MKKIVLVSIFLPALLFAANWNVFKGNLHFTGNNDQLIVSSSNIQWSFTAESLLFHPVPTENSVIVVSLNKKVFCLDSRDGSLLWKLDLKALSSHFGSGTRSLGKIKYPVIHQNILIVSDASILFAIDLNKGSPLWARAGAQELVKDKFVIDGIYSTPLISGQAVFYGSRNHFLSRNLFNGHLLWYSDQIHTYNGFPSFYDRFILTQNRDYLRQRFEILKMDRSEGAVLWKKNIEIPLILFSPVEFQDRIWIVGTTNLFSLDEKTGRILQKFSFPEPITAQPGFSDRKIILSVGNRKLLRFDPKTLKIKTLFETDYRSSPQYVLIEDLIYLIYGNEDSGTEIKVIQANSLKTLWKKSLPEKWYQSVPSAAHQSLYVSVGSTLYAIGKKKTPDLNDLNRGLAQNSSNQNPDLTLDLAKITKNTPVILKNIYFEYNSSYLKKESIETLNHLVAQLKKYPVKLRILGHTDSIGDETKNQILSEKRAYSVMEYLIKQGISPKRLHAVGFGESRPIADNNTEEGRKKNRRTEFIIEE